MPTELPRLSLHEWSCLRTELVWIYDRAPREQARHATVDHRRGNWAWYLRKGSVTIATKAGTFTAKAGQWFFPPAEISRQDFSDDAQLLSICFLCQWPSGENLFGSPGRIVVDGHRCPGLKKTALSLERLVRRHFPVPHHTYAYQASDYPLFLRFQRAFFDWLEAWFQLRLALGAEPTRHGGNERAIRAARALDQAPFAGGFPEKSLSSEAGVSTVQLNRLFRHQFKLTPRQYWERRRVEFSRLCLETSDLPLKAIAASLGFRSDSHFTVWFKRHARVSPSAYRDQHARA
jgi:AraC-like DNA-binding protein